MYVSGASEDIKLADQGEESDLQKAPYTQACLLECNHMRYDAYRAASAPGAPAYDRHYVGKHQNKPQTREWIRQ